MPPFSPGIHFFSINRSLPSARLSINFLSITSSPSLLLHRHLHTRADVLFDQSLHWHLDTLRLSPVVISATSYSSRSWFYRRHNSQTITMPRGIRKARAPVPAMKKDFEDLREKAISSLRAQDHLYAQVIPSSPRDQESVTSVQGGYPSAGDTASGKAAGRPYQTFYGGSLPGNGAYEQRSYVQKPYGQEVPNSIRVPRPRNDAMQSHTPRGASSTSSTQQHFPPSIHGYFDDDEILERRSPTQLPTENPGFNTEDMNLSTTRTPPLSTTHKVSENVLGGDFRISGSSSQRHGTDPEQAQPSSTVVRTTKTTETTTTTGNTTTTTTITTTTTTTTTTTVNRAPQNQITSRSYEWKGDEEGSEQQAQETWDGRPFSQGYDHAEFTFKPPKIQYKNPYAPQQTIRHDTRAPNGWVEDYVEDDSSQEQSFSDSRVGPDQPHYSSNSSKSRASGSLKARTTGNLKSGATGRKRGRNEVYDELTARETEEKLLKVLKRAGLP